MKKNFNWLTHLSLWSISFYLSLMVSGCTINLTENLATDHSSESISDKRETDTKLDSEVEGKGSLFGLW